MKEIYTITAIFVDDKKQSMGATRCFGWFESLEKARQIIANPNNGFSEAYYNHLVIECWPPGSHSTAKEIVWFNTEIGNIWNECDKPKVLEGTINFAIC